LVLSQKEVLWPTLAQLKEVEAKWVEVEVQWSELRVEWAQVGF
jgi:hypothetical protein